jgi:hypothetical protein
MRSVVEESDILQGVKLGVWLSQSISASVLVAILLSMLVGALGTLLSVFLERELRRTREGLVGGFHHWPPHRAAGDEGPLI